MAKAPIVYFKAAVYGVFAAAIAGGLGSVFDAAAASETGVLEHTYARTIALIAGVSAYLWRYYQED
jgi:hypothetical protein